MSRQTIYNTLRAFGFTYEAVIAMMANWQEESNNESVRLQGDFSPFRTASKNYMKKVESGEISRQVWAFDEKGWGIAQFTYSSRKLALYDFWKAYGGSIGDLQMQLDYVLHELKTEFHIARSKYGYDTLYEELCTCHDLQKLVKDILYVYENPTEKINNYNRRMTNAYNIKAEFPEKAEVVISPEPEKEETYWPPRMICKGMAGDDVAVLQALLKARGFTCDITGEFDVKTHNMTIAFQSAEGLDQDGIAGPKTWGRLLERG